jgi:hypothetical protein
MVGNSCASELFRLLLRHLSIKTLRHIIPKTTGYSILNSWQRHSHEAEHSAKRHHHRERHRQNPNRRRTELCAPQSHCDHCQHVVESGDRVSKAGKKTFGRVARHPVGIQTLSASRECSFQFSFKETISDGYSSSNKNSSEGFVRISMSRRIPSATMAKRRSMRMQLKR